eukprot:825319-Amphidinium_carterae.1
MPGRNSNLNLAMCVKCPESQIVRCRAKQGATSQRLPLTACSGRGVGSTRQGPPEKRRCSA